MGGAGTADSADRPIPIYHLGWRNAYDPDLANCFREINGLSRDTTLVFLPPGTYETWPNISPEQWRGRVEFGPSYEPLRLIP